MKQFRGTYTVLVTPFTPDGKQVDVAAAVGVRVREEPQGVHRFTVATGSAADGVTVENLGEHVGDAWVSIVVRASELIPVRAETELRAGDDVVVLAEPELGDRLETMFRRRA